MKTPNVSLNVQSNVSLSQHGNFESTQPVKRSNLSVGRYLVRSGNILLFQMRLPKSMVTSGPDIIRISLGALALRQAREIADELASTVRAFGRAWERSMDDKQENTSFEGEEGDLEYDQRELTALQMKTLFKSLAYEIKHSKYVPSPLEEKGQEFMRNLLSIQREVTAKEKNEPHNSLIAENARLMAATFGKKWLEETAGLRQEDLQQPEMIDIDEGLAETLNTEPTPSQPHLKIAPTPAEPVIATTPITGTKPLKNSEKIPAFKQDRRTVQRPASDKPLFSDLAAEYLALRESKSNTANKDINIARFRIDLFIDLIGDHPVDTYTGTDLQAYVELIKYWPANAKDRDANKTPREIIASNRDMRLLPLAHKTLVQGYVAIVKTVITSGQTNYNYPNPIANVKLSYPDTARPSVSAEPLSPEKINQLFITGVESGFLDNAMLPLLAHLTGRRLGLLVHLKGSDFRQKFKDVWIAQTNGIIQLNGKWQRNPIKTEASTSFYVLHNILEEIGFIKWAASKGDAFLFSELMRLADPSKSASSYMNRLFKKAGIKDTPNEVFHSLRSGYISDMSEQQIDRRERKLQVGHSVGQEEHEKYGHKTLTEVQARRFATLPIAEEIDLSIYQNLDFEKMAKKSRSQRPNTAAIHLSTGN
ncbi:integrase [Paenochrobactrum gallinarii]|uniref:Integrase n=1 Tax=Paenochrobactrum gallinarii TaxID=643673 RepID=A0A841LXX8_9HYPH|nr:hypothetical protein [Paenochrobactrum gallinarii]MBB6262216.1 integrase [Paenochrobactrum gallinarii]